MEASVRVVVAGVRATEVMRGFRIVEGTVEDLMRGLAAEATGLGRTLAEEGVCEGRAERREEGLVAERPLRMTGVAVVDGVAVGREEGRAVLDGVGRVVDMARGRLVMGAEDRPGVEVDEGRVAVEVVGTRRTAVEAWTGVCEGAGFVVEGVFLGRPRSSSSSESGRERIAVSDHSTQCLDLARKTDRCS